MAQEIGVVSFFFVANQNCCHSLIFINPNPEGNIQPLIFQNTCFSSPKKAAGFYEAKKFKCVWFGKRGILWVLGGLCGKWPFFRSAIVIRSRVTGRYFPWNTSLELNPGTGALFVKTLSFLKEMYLFTYHKKFNRYFSFREKCRQLELKKVVFTNPSSEKEPWKLKGCNCYLWSLALLTFVKLV